MESESLKRNLATALAQLEDAKKAPVYNWRNTVSNGVSMALSDNTNHRNSRASTPTPPAKPGRRELPISSLATPESDNDAPVTSTWDSMHAPKASRGRAKGQEYLVSNSRYPTELVRRSTASPTPSIVSNAPTLQDDGWWA